MPVNNNLKSQTTHAESSPPSQSSTPVDNNSKPNTPVATKSTWIVSSTWYSIAWFTKDEFKNASILKNIYQIFKAVILAPGFLLSFSADVLYKTGSGIGSAVTSVGRKIFGKKDSKADDQKPLDNKKTDTDTKKTDEKKPTDDISTDDISTDSGDESISSETSDESEAPQDEPKFVPFSKKESDKVWKNSYRLREMYNVGHLFKEPLTDETISDLGLDDSGPADFDVIGLDSLMRRAGTWLSGVKDKTSKYLNDSYQYAKDSYNDFTWYPSSYEEEESIYNGTWELGFSGLTGEQAEAGGGLTAWEVEQQKLKVLEKEKSAKFKAQLDVLANQENPGLKKTFITEFKNIFKGTCPSDQKKPLPPVDDRGLSHLSDLIEEEPKYLSFTEDNDWNLDFSYLTGEVTAADKWEEVIANRRKEINEKKLEELKERMAKVPSRADTRKAQFNALREHTTPSSTQKIKTVVRDAKAAIGRSDGIHRLSQLATAGVNLGTEILSTGRSLFDMLKRKDTGNPAPGAKKKTHRQKHKKAQRKRNRI